MAWRSTGFDSVTVLFIACIIIVTDIHTRISNRDCIG
jgi:hypothetical protein